MTYLEIFFLLWGVAAIWESYKFAKRTPAHVPNRWLKIIGGAIGMGLAYAIFGTAFAWIFGKLL